MTRPRPTRTVAQLDVERITGAGQDRSQRLRCSHCSDVIGVYEALIALTPYGPLQTSLVADPWLAQAAHTCFHAACHELARRSCG